MKTYLSFFLAAMLAAVASCVRSFSSDAPGGGGDDPAEANPGGRKPDGRKPGGRKPGPANPDGTGRVPPLTPIYVESYAFNGCSNREICDRFGVDEELLTGCFNDLLRTTRAMRAYQLRKAQTDQALGGNVSELTWLGRNELGQSLNPESDDAELPTLPPKNG